MKAKFERINGELLNLLIGAIGIILILLSVLESVGDFGKSILLSIGTSFLATAIVTALTSRYLLSQNKMVSMVEKWGLAGIYTARAHINKYTNKALLRANTLDICAMGLKGFRDAQGKNIAKRISRGMRLRILTLDPSNPYLSEVDRNEGIALGSTKATIESLIQWVAELQKLQRFSGQVEIKTYMDYPHDFYFCIDGTVFIGPYESKTSQQTITYRFNANGQGARYYSDNFDYLWRKC